MAVDYLGNKTVKYVEITNYDSSILQIPTVDSYSNRKSAITGTGEPFSTVHFSCKTGTYETTAASDGTFSYELPRQEADSVIKVHLTDRSGRKSAIVSVTVGRTGPNYPDVNPLTNKSSKITGDLNDKTSQVFAVIGSKVYVSKNGGKKYYKASTLYNPSKTIVSTTFSTSGTNFTLQIPVQKAGTAVKVYAVDKIGRTNKVTKLVTEDVAPNQPLIYTASNAENHVFGYVPKPKSVYDIKVTIDGSTYTTKTNEKGYFTVKTSNLQKDKVIYATASDTVNGKTRTSAKGSRTISDYSAYEKGESLSGITLTPMTNKDTVLTGKINSGAVDALYLKVDDKCHTISTTPDGTFTFELLESLTPGKSIYVIHRNQYSNIKEAAKVTVTLALPETPQLLTETIYNNTTSVSVLCEDLCTANVKVNETIYSTDKGTYDDTLGGYIYVIEMDKCPAGSPVSVYMENATGKSERIQTEIMGKIPEISALSEVTIKDRKVTGNVTLVLPVTTVNIPENESSPSDTTVDIPSSTLPLPEETTEEITEEAPKEIIPTVENTETKVYAKVKKKGKEDITYEGKIKADGTFKVVFDEKPAKGAKVVVWAENANGRCDKIILIVI